MPSYAKSFLVGLVLLLSTPASVHADESFVAIASGVDILRLSRKGTIRRLGDGGGLGITLLERIRDGRPGNKLSLAVDASVFFVARGGGEWVVDFAVTTYLTLVVTREVINPFMALGVDLAYVRVDDLNGRIAEGLMPGVHGDVGVHGFVVPDELYYRVSVGYWGAGVGGLRSQVSLGYVLE